MTFVVGLIGTLIWDIVVPIVTGTNAKFFTLFTFLSLAGLLTTGIILSDWKNNSQQEITRPDIQLLLIMQSLFGLIFGFTAFSEREFLFGGAYLLLTFWNSWFIPPWRKFLQNILTKKRRKSKS